MATWIMGHLHNRSRNLLQVTPHQQLHLTNPWRLQSRVPANPLHLTSTHPPLMRTSTSRSWFNAKTWKSFWNLTATWFPVIKHLLPLLSNISCLEINQLDSDMKTLVYENYNKFISATDTIRQVWCTDVLFSPDTDEKQCCEHGRGNEETFGQHGYDHEVQYWN